MENEWPINLKKFIPAKANKYYLLKILFYVVFLIVIGTILLYKMNGLQKDNSPSTKEIKEVRGVTVETE